MSDEKLLKKQKEYKRAYIVSVVLAVVFVVCLTQDILPHWSIYVLLLLVIIGAWGIGQDLRKTYKKLFFDAAYFRAMNQTFADVKVRHNSEGLRDEGIVEQIREADLKSIGSNFIVEPVTAVEASYNGLPFVMYEYRIVKLKQIDKKAPPEKLIKYEGRFLKVGLLEQFTGEVQVHAIPEVLYKPRLEQVEFEDVEFNQNLKVFASSQLDAFRLIQPKTLLLFKDIYQKRMYEEIAINMDFCFLDGTFNICQKAFNTTIRAPFFKRANTEKARKKVGEVAGWIERNITDFKLDSERYITGR